MAFSRWERVALEAGPLFHRTFCPPVFSLGQAHDNPFALVGKSAVARPQPAPQTGKPLSGAHLPPSSEVQHA
jgi:hypothetical protein